MCNIQNIKLDLNHKSVLNLHGSPVNRTLFIYHAKLDFSMMILAWCRYPKKDRNKSNALFWDNNTMLKSHAKIKFRMVDKKGSVFCNIGA